MAENQPAADSGPKTEPFPARFEEIYLSHYKRIYNYIYSCIQHREISEDLTADVFAAVHENLERLDPGRGSISAWVYTVARNTVLDFRKRAAFHREVLGDVPETAASDQPFPESGGKDDTLRNPDNIWLARILCRLTEEEANLLMFRYQLQLSNAEVGNILDISTDAVSKRYQRLLQKCRQMAAEEE